MGTSKTGPPIPVSIALSFANAPDEVFQGAIAALQIAGRIETTEPNRHRARARITKGVEQAWHPVIVDVEVTANPDRTILRIKVEQQQAGNLPDQRPIAVDQFTTLLQRRQDLNPLD